MLSSASCLLDTRTIKHDLAPAFGRGAFSHSRAIQQAQQEIFLFLPGGAVLGVHLAAERGRLGFSPLLLATSARPCAALATTSAFVRWQRTSASTAEPRFVAVART